MTRPKLDESALRQICFDLARATSWEPDNPIATSLDQIAPKAYDYFETAKRFSIQFADDGLDPNLIVGALHHLQPHTVPPIGEDRQWLSDALQVYAELFVPTVELDQRGKTFLIALCNAIRASTGDGTTQILSLPITELWTSGDLHQWTLALERYWLFVQPKHQALEHRLEKLSTEYVRGLNETEWYEFLRDEYFRWKYTAANRYATTTKRLRTYLEENRLSELHCLKEQILAISPADVLGGLSIKIRGLGTAGISGLLSLLYPQTFATVDQFVVKALRQVSGLPESAALERMNPEGLTVKDGALLIQILQRKAAENNRQFGVTTWTPRKIDKILWTYGRN